MPYQLFGAEGMPLNPDIVIMRNELTYPCCIFIIVRVFTLLPYRIDTGLGQSSVTWVLTQVGELMEIISYTST